MRLSRLYSNRHVDFAPIDFSLGLSVILAEIRLPGNRSKDTHNLGKTVLGRLVDFCLLSRKHKDFFLFKHEEIFNEFIFFIEIELNDGGYVTVRRAVSKPSKISFRKHAAREQDYTNLDQDDWDHFDVAFDKAYQLLDSYLNFSDIKPWGYRKGLAYFLRSQDDFKEVFHLSKFAGKHSAWKPYLAHILGFDSSKIELQYEKEELLSERKALEENLKNEMPSKLIEDGKLDGLLLLHREEAEKKQLLIDSFDFEPDDQVETKRVVDEIDEEISELNSRRYTYSRNRRKILTSLDEQKILFDPDAAKALFDEAGIVFEGQIKRDYKQLIDFNVAITSERADYLRQESDEIKIELEEIEKRLIELNRVRAAKLKKITDTDILEKYKVLTGELVKTKTELASLEIQKEHMDRLGVLRNEIRDLVSEKNRIADEITADIKSKGEDGESLYSSIRLYFSKIVEDVINCKALLNVVQNKEGHLEFKTEILDSTGKSTSADLGTTYRKLLCIALDLALLRAHIENRFFRFVYHDGVFETLDDRKKENLLGVLREYNTLGIQTVITLIDSDLPKSPIQN